MLILDYWKRRWQSVYFDAEEQAFELKWLPKKRNSLTGWASKEKGLWYAFYHHGEDNCLLADKQMFTVDSSLSAENKLDGNQRVFNLYKNQDLIFQLSYKAKDRFNDPTFDTLDLQEEDFFFWSAYLINNQQNLSNIFKNRE